MVEAFRDQEGIEPHFLTGMNCTQLNCFYDTDTGVKFFFFLLVLALMEDDVAAPGVAENDKREAEAAGQPKGVRSTLLFQSFFFS